ncbi:hypothetical protein D3C76_890210 [compost metagenome]
MQLFVVFAVTQYGHRLLLASLVGAVCGATAKDFQDVPAVLSLERLGQLTLRGLGHHFAELWNQYARVDPVQVAAIERGTRIFRVAFRQFAEVFTRFDAAVERLGQGLGFSFVTNRTWFDQDVADMHFVAYLGFTATLAGDLQDDEATWRAHWLSDVANRHGAQQLIERRWQLCGFTPAHVAAFQCGFAGGFGEGQLSEVSALLELLVHRVSLFGCSLNGLGIGAFRRGNHDVGQAELLGQLHFAKV